MSENSKCLTLVHKFNLFSFTNLLCATILWRWKKLSSEIIFSLIVDSRRRIFQLLLFMKQQLFYHLNGTRSDFSSLAKQHFFAQRDGYKKWVLPHEVALSDVDNIVIEKEVRKHTLNILLIKLALGNLRLISQTFFFLSLCLYLN